MKVIGAHGQKIKRRTNVRRGRVLLAGSGFSVIPGSSARSQFYAYLRGQGLSVADATATAKARYPTRKRNPKGTRVARCVSDVKRANRARRAAHKKTVRSPIAACQKATCQSYATGRRIARKSAGKALRANPLPVRVSFKEGPPFAIFRSLPRARQYAQALADHTGRQVRVRV